MAGGADQAVRALAFGEAGRGQWGAAWLAPGDEAVGVLALDGPAGTGPMTVDGTGPEEPWRLDTPGGVLVLEGASDPVWRDPDAPDQGFDQLCRVTGPIDCLGWRATRPAKLDPSVGSFRLAGGWFDASEGFALVALRPRKSKAQDEDRIEAVLFDPGAAHLVAEPRLSTTYSESGQPIRAGIELWMETEPESDHLYPRRAVGEALAAPVGWRAADLALQAQPFRWFSAGREGSGVYLLGQR